MDIPFLMAWLKDKNRKPAFLTFTAGEEREAAYWVEMGMTEATKIEKTTLYSIDCRTGCSCCRGENHSRGLYATYEEAERRVKNFESMPLLASQYSKTGRYAIQVHEAERLPDGRIIVGDERVINAEKICAVDENGNVSSEDHLGEEGWPR